jgi:carboxynorspermidine decarboxylase
MDLRITSLPTPCYVVYEERLRRNLDIIRRVSTEAEVKIIMAFKANALWKTFPIIKEYVDSSTASSLNEMRLSLDYLGHDVHAYCPVYTDDSFPQFLQGCSHITFNSLAQFNKYLPLVKALKKNNPQHHCSLGLRVNPQCSVIDTDIYNPALPGSRFGVERQQMPESLPNGLEGLHFHALCESSSYDLEKVLEAFKRDFGYLLPHLKWVNMGGGHLMTRADYDTNHLISLLTNFRHEYPNLEVILEPGSAFTWQTGDLITKVLDIVENHGIKTAIIDASFACHMPDCLEMPYQPAIEEASDDNAKYSYRLGGNSCLSGDFVGNWHFDTPLKPGDKLTLLDMNHYTTVKTNMFNGIQHPSIWFIPIKGEPILLREFTYDDYRQRMD